jgi:hypothetical protein
MPDLKISILAIKKASTFQLRLYLDAETGLEPVTFGL